MIGAEIMFLFNAPSSTDDFELDLDKSVTSC